MILNNTLLNSDKHAEAKTMATILHTINSNAIFYIKTSQFRINFSDVCSLGSNWQYISRQQAIIWTIHGLVDWRIYL